MTEAVGVMQTMAGPALQYLGGYPPGVMDQVRGLIDAGRLGAWVQQRHPQWHDVRTDRALYDYVMQLKAEHMRSSVPVAKVVYDDRLQLLRQALGTHTAASRVQGRKLTAKREIRIASVFKQAPASLLRAIVVHELAHLKERAHDRAFYALCRHMEPNYHALELDMRLWLTARDLGMLAGAAPRPPGPDQGTAAG